MSSHRYIHQISKMILIKAFLFGCAGPTATPPPDEMDKSPFTGIPCAAPCWHGLEVGNSSESDVLSTLSTLTYINQDTITIHPVQSLPSINPGTWSQGIMIFANCVYPDKQCLAISVVDDILTEIIVLLIYELEVSEAVKYLGRPDHIGFDRAGGEQVACRVYLIWSEKQLVLASKIFEGPNAAEKNCFSIRDTGKASAKLLISEAKYMSVAAIEELLSGIRSEFFQYMGTT